MSYVEQLVASPVVACTWEQVAAAGQEHRVVPDACVDLIWSGDRLSIAGPDTTARVVTLALGALGNHPAVFQLDPDHAVLQDPAASWCRIISKDDALMVGRDTGLVNT